MIIHPNEMPTHWVLWRRGERLLAWGSDRAVEHVHRLGFNGLVLTASGCQHVGAAHLETAPLAVLRVPYDDDGAAMADEALKRRICEVARAVASRIARAQNSLFPHVTPLDVMLHHGLDEAEVHALLTGWDARGWVNHGVSLRTCWLEDEGRAALVEMLARTEGT